MADEADSKSVVGNHVWVQVPSPALLTKPRKYAEEALKSAVSGVFLFVNIKLFFNKNSPFLIKICHGFATDS